MFIWVTTTFNTQMAIRVSEIEHMYYSEKYFIICLSSTVEVWLNPEEGTRVLNLLKSIEGVYFRSEQDQKQITGSN